MTYTRDVVVDLLRKGENERVEFKFDIHNPEPLARSISALANAAGGVIIVGADDRGLIVGADIPKIQQLYERAVQLVGPSASTNFHVIDLGSPQRLAVISVEKSSGLTLSAAGAFRRQGSVDRPMSADDVIRALSRTDLSVAAVRDRLAGMIAQLTQRVETMQTELAHAHSSGSKWKDYLVGGVVGAIISAVLALVLK